MNPGISTYIPHKIPEWQLLAIRHMENEYKAYLPGLVKPRKFGHIDKKLNDGSFIHMTYNDPYGLFLTTNILPKDTKGWKQQTYCNLGVAAFIYYFTGADKIGLTYAQARKGRHILHTFCQTSANECVRRLENGYLNDNNFDIEVKKVDSVFDATYYAQQGVFIIAAWENPEWYIDSKGKKRQKPGHVSTIIGGKQTESKLMYEFAYPMTFNIGSKNGYMELADAFYTRKKAKDIKFYLVTQE